MGVLYDYFSAPSDDVAAATLDIVGGPGRGGPPLPMPAADILRRYGRQRLAELARPRVWLADSGLHTVATKGFDPTDLTLVEGYLTGVDSDDLLARPQTLRLVAERDGTEKFVVAFTDTLQAVLAGSTAAQLEAAAHRWAQADGSGGEGHLAHLLSELSELASGATERGEYLYCWVCV